MKERASSKKIDFFVKCIMYVLCIMYVMNLLCNILQYKKIGLKQVIFQRAYVSKNQMIYLLFNVHRFNELQNVFSTLSFPFVYYEVKMFFAFQEAQRSEVLEAKIFSSSLGTTGICFLTGDYQYFVVNNIDEVKVKPLQCPFCK